MADTRRSRRENPKRYSLPEIPKGKRRSGKDKKAKPYPPSEQLKRLGSTVGYIPVGAGVGAGVGAAVKGVGATNKVRKTLQKVKGNPGATKAVKVTAPKKVRQGTTEGAKKGAPIGASGGAVVGTASQEKTSNKKSAPKKKSTQQRIDEREARMSRRGKTSAKPVPAGRTVRKPKTATTTNTSSKPTTRTASSSKPTSTRSSAPKKTNKSPRMMDSMFGGSSNNTSTTRNSGPKPKKNEGYTNYQKIMRGVS